MSQKHSTKSRKQLRNTEKTAETFLASAAINAAELSSAELKRCLELKGVPVSERKSLKSKAALVKRVEELCGNSAQRVQNALDERSAAQDSQAANSKHGFARLGTDLLIAVARLLDVNSHVVLAGVSRWFRVRLTLSLKGTASPGLQSLRGLRLGATPVLPTALTECCRRASSLEHLTLDIQQPSVLRALASLQECTRLQSLSITMDKEVLKQPWTRHNRGTAPTLSLPALNCARLVKLEIVGGAGCVEGQLPIADVIRGCRALKYLHLHRMPFDHHALVAALRDVGIALETLRWTGNWCNWHETSVSLAHLTSVTEFACDDDRDERSISALPPNLTALACRPCLARLISTAPDPSRLRALTLYCSDICEYDVDYRLRDIAAIKKFKFFTALQQVTLKHVLWSVAQDLLPAIHGWLSAGALPVLSSLTVSFVRALYRYDRLHEGDRALVTRLFNEHRTLLSATRPAVAFAGLWIDENGQSQSM